MQRLSLQVLDGLTNRRGGKRVGDWLFVNQPRTLDPLSLAAMSLLQALVMRPELSELRFGKKKEKKGLGMGTGMIMII